MLAPASGRGTLCAPSNARSKQLRTAAVHGTDGHNSARTTHVACFCRRHSRAVDLCVRLSVLRVLQFRGRLRDRPVACRFAGFVSADACDQLVVEFLVLRRKFHN